LGKRVEIDKDYLRTAYTEKSMSTREIARELGINKSTVLDRLREYDIVRVEKPLTNNKDFSPLETELLIQLKRQKISKNELGKVLKNLNEINPKKYRTQKIDFNAQHVKYGYISDTHMGHSCYRRDVMDVAAKAFKEEGIDFIINPGDTLEGMSNRDGHIYELDFVGMDAQFDFFEQEFQKLADFDVYSIEAQDSHGGWGHNKANQGIDIGKELALRAPNYKFIGFNEQDLELDNGLKIRLRHPGGGTAYALSYKAQKYIESIGGGNKPNILHTGHFHKRCSIFYRNIYSIDSATLCNQTPFMKKIGTPAHVGFGIVDVVMNKDKNKGIERLSDTFFPFYD